MQVPGEDNEGDCNLSQSLLNSVAIYGDWTKSGYERKKQLLALDRKVLHRYTVAGWSILKRISQSYCKLVLTDCCYCIYRCQFCYLFQETVVKEKEKTNFCIKYIHFTFYGAILVLLKTKTRIHLIFCKVLGIFRKNGWHKTNYLCVHEQYKKYVEFISNKTNKKENTNRA